MCSSWHDLVTISLFFFFLGQTDLPLLLMLITMGSNHFVRSILCSVTFYPNISEIRECCQVNDCQAIYCDRCNATLQCTKISHISARPFAQRLVQYRATLPACLQLGAQLSCSVPGRKMFGTLSTVQTVYQNCFVNKHSAKDNLANVFQRWHCLFQIVSKLCLEEKQGPLDTDPKTALLLFKWLLLRNMRIILQKRIHSIVLLLSLYWW